MGIIFSTRHQQSEYVLLDYDYNDYFGIEAKLSQKWCIKQHIKQYKTVYSTFCPLIDINDPALQLIVCDVHFHFHGLQVMQLALQGYCGLQTQMTMREMPTTLTIVDKDCQVPSLLENHIQHWLNIQYIRIYVDNQYTGVCGTKI